MLCLHYRFNYHYQPLLLKNTTKPTHNNLHQLQTAHYSVNTFNMFSITSSLALFAISAVALPTTLTTRQSSSQLTFTIINDQTGAQAAATIPIDGTSHTFESLFGSSPLASNGEILATSSQLIAFPQVFDCAIINSAQAPVGYFNPSHTYVDLDGNPNAAVPVDVSGDSITCTY